MKRLFILLCASFLALTATAQDPAQTRPLGEVLDGISKQFGVHLKIEVDTAGLKVPYAASRIRPYSVEESMDNVLKMFDYKFVKQHDTYYKIKSGDIEYILLPPCEYLRPVSAYENVYESYYDIKSAILKMIEFGYEEIYLHSAGSPGFCGLFVRDSDI